MSDERDNLPTRRDGFSLARQGSLLDEALAKLPKEEQERLIVKALEKRMDIDADAERADLRYRNSSVDMANTIRQLDALEKTSKSDYTYEAKYETASGRTTVEVKKSNNTVIIVIAIVVGIVILLMFA